MHGLGVHGLPPASVELNGNPTPFPWAAQIRFAPRRGFLGRTKSCHPFSSENLGHSYKTLSGFDPKKKLLVQWDYLPHSWQIGIFSNALTKKTEEMSAPGGVENSRPFSGDSFVDRDTPCWVTNQETDLRLWCACTGISGLVIWQRSGKCQR